MFVDDDYVNLVDDPTSVEVEASGCVWMGCLYERKSGGFDLFYDHANSYFKPLNVSTITRLRHLSELDGGILFITHLPGQRIERKLLEEAKRLLLNWITRTVGES